MLCLGNKDIKFEPPLKVRLTPHSPDIFVEVVQVGADIESFGVAKHSVLQKLRSLIAKQKEQYLADEIKTKLSNVKIELYFYHGDIPIIDTMIKQSKGEPTLFGLYRDRFPDNSWGELRWRNLEFSKEHVTKITNMSEYYNLLSKDPGLKLSILQDLAYAFGEDTDKFTKQLNHFKLV